MQTDKYLQVYCVSRVSHPNCTPTPVTSTTEKNPTTNQIREQQTGSETRKITLSSVTVETVNHTLYSSQASFQILGKELNLLADSWSTGYMADLGVSPHIG